MKVTRPPRGRRLSRTLLWDAACAVTDYALRYGNFQVNAYSCYRVRDESAPSDFHKEAGVKAMRGYINLAAWAGAPTDPSSPGELAELAHWVREHEQWRTTDAVYTRANELRFDFLHLLSLSYEP